jgi:hypothetical protein
VLYITLIISLLPIITVGVEICLQSIYSIVILVQFNSYIFSKLLIWLNPEHEFDNKFQFGLQKISIG